MVLYIGDGQRRMKIFVRHCEIVNDKTEEREEERGRNQEPNQVTLFREYVLQRLGISFSASQSQSKQEAEKIMVKDDLVKLVVEKEELLKIKDDEFQKMKKKSLRSYVEMENVINRTKREEGNFKKFAIQVSFSRHVLYQILLHLLIGVVPLLKTLPEGVKINDK
ncbi:grpE protein homolog 2, mitochondrial-like [Solanum lycopersicum]|uniref:grpE protein homolog 2, mitochondrial-like n=1 Tax=Solanum lycopersicum TaxID=4081 RepID=UPI000532C96C|nr:grpE protein homolog 2, mitochondrial-like [Solanum lycopersicum]